MRKLTKMKKTILVETLALATMFSGCKTGMFAPRTGELFQTTRMGPGKTPESCCMVTVWGLFAASEGHSFGYLVAYCR